jgi:hypothetical protein
MFSKVNGQELRWFDPAARFMCSPGANLGKLPRQVSMIQLEKVGQAKNAETQKRNPGDDKTGCRQKTPPHI